MTTLQISEELAQTIQEAATEQDVSVEDYLLQMVRRDRTLMQKRKIEREQAWWLAQPLSERAKYEGKHIAVHRQELVDHDLDKQALHKRIREKYGSTAVLIMPAEGPREIYIYSPRLIRA